MNMSWNFNGVMKEEYKPYVERQLMSKLLNYSHKDIDILLQDLSQTTLELVFIWW